MRKREIDVTSGVAPSTEESGRGSPRVVLLAMLPHLLMSSTFFGVSEAFGSRGIPWYPYFLVAVVALAFLIAWRREWPLWSGSWAGYWLLALFLLLRVPGLYRWWSSSEMLFFVLIAAACILIVRRRPLHGLLAAMPLFVLLPHIWAFELVEGGNWIWGGVFVLLALTAGAVVWMGSVRAGALLVSGYHLLAGLAFALGILTLPYRFSEMMGARETLTFAALINEFVPDTVAVIAGSLTLLILPALRRLASRAESGGRRSEVLLVGGMLLTLGAVLALRAQPASQLAVVALAVGLLLSMGAALALIRAVLPKAQNRVQVLLTPLLSVFAPLVVLALATPFAPVGAYTSSTRAWIFLSYSGVLLWVAAAFWVIMTGGADDGSADGAERMGGYAPSPPDGGANLDTGEEVNYSV